MEAQKINFEEIYSPNCKQTLEDYQMEMRDQILDMDLDSPKNTKSPKKEEKSSSDMIDSPFAKKQIGQIKPSKPKNNGVGSFWQGMQAQVFRINLNYEEINLPEGQTLPISVQVEIPGDWTIEQSIVFILDAFTKQLQKFKINAKFSDNMKEWGLVQAKKNGRPKDEPFFAKEIKLSETRVAQYSLCPLKKTAVQITYKQSNFLPEESPTALNSQESHDFAYHSTNNNVNQNPINSDNNQPKNQNSNQNSNQTANQTRSTNKQNDQLTAPQDSHNTNSSSSQLRAENSYGRGLIQANNNSGHRNSHREQPSTSEDDITGGGCLCFGSSKKPVRSN